MAILQTIRTRFGTLIVVVIGIALGLFVLSSALEDFSLFQKKSNVVGTIDGNDIEINDYLIVENQMVKNYESQMQTSSLDEMTMNSIREQAWNKILNDQISGGEYKKLGISVSGEEQRDMFFSKDALPDIQQVPGFTNEMGQFDPSKVVNYYNQIKDWANAPEEQQEQIKKQYDQWIAYQNGKVEERHSTKYQNMIAKSLYVPKWQVEADYNEKNTPAEIRFISIPYATIVDSTIKVTDEELQEYLNRNKVKFKQEESRQLDLVLFPVKPSLQDTSIVRDDINSIYAQLLANPQDTDILKLNSPNGQLNTFYYKQDQIESLAVQDTLFKMTIGSIYDPYFEDQKFKIVKLMDRRIVADSVKARHIIISTQNLDTTAAQLKADSILAAYKAGSVFDSLAARFSEDPATKDNAGEMGFLPQGATLQPINKFMFFDGVVGETKVVRTQAGYHVIEILEKKNEAEAVQINFITRDLIASSETHTAIYEQASQFAVSVTGADQFKEMAASQRLNFQSAPSVSKTSYQLPGTTAARQVVQWAYDAKVGGVSEVIDCDGGEVYAVACLTGIKEKGTMTVEQARQQLEVAVRKEKKGKIISAQLNMLMAINVTIESVALNVNQQVKTASNVMFSNSGVPNLGYEPRVVGSVFSLQPNEVSRPILGEQGVFIIQVVSVTPAQPVADYNQFKQQIIGANQQRIQTGLAEALKKAVDVKDHRYLFF